MVVSGTVHRRAVELHPSWFVLGLTRAQRSPQQLHPSASHQRVIPRSGDVGVCTGAAHELQKRLPSSGDELLAAQEKQTSGDNLQGVYQPSCAIRQMRYRIRSNVFKATHWQMNGPDGRGLRRRIGSSLPDLLGLQPDAYRSDQLAFWQ